MNIKTTSDIVKDILIECPETRDSDNVLYIEVCKKICPETEHYLAFDLLRHHKDLGIPGFETVRRTRQKLQATYPRLAASSDVEAGRMINEEEFRHYARQVIV